MKSEQQVSACLERIAEREREVHAWAYLDAERALAEARARDREAPRSALHGVPVGIKDVIDTADMPTEYNSPIYRGHQPKWDAACVTLLRRAGCVILGKTVTTEFATMVPAATVHPKNPKHTPGGSSSGSAAAVAAGMVRFAFGTQTVGSIIRPAAYCGVVGYKPSFGTLSRSGMKMGCDTLDTAGVIARSVDDAALLVAGSAMRSDLLEIAAAEKPELAVCRSPNWHHMSPEGAAAFEAAAKRLAAKGARLVDLELDFPQLDAAASTILVYEMARALAYEITNHRARVSPMLLERVDSGATMPYAQYAKAMAYAAECRRRLRDLAGEADAILTPSATGEAPLGLGSTGNTAMNRLWTLLHGPCVTVPAGDGPAGLPMGIQIVGLSGEDARTLAVAKWVEGAL